MTGPLEPVRRRQTVFRRIDQVLKVTLPPAFARFAEECPIYGTWFVSIGADYESWMHILKLNEGFREPMTKANHYLLT
jgi:hypothetical protein